MTTRQTLLALALLAAQPMPAAAEFAGAEAIRDLNGTFRSAAPEPWYGGFGTREFVFADGQWQLTFTHALDPAMTLRTFQFRTGGRYEVGAPVAAVPGTFEGNFEEAWKHVTLLTPDAGIAAAMGMADCGLTVNLETDISATGCAGWAPVEVCGWDHDLIALDETGVHFGVRPADNDLCTPDRRPAALLPAVPAFR
ncbi:hypothetical protein [Roseicyclus persicicus]|uniref:APCDD1 domain-containing protein n=1 Tax=Roseicyclus persicicus TaxID=2650661 RepID=A0A7X6JXF9_9RHOB|nr:hypothetical protein [Roseibacterium persicicum]NKX43349.1 hypothetical protein [Roseibacterium persicicum]